MSTIVPFYTEEVDFARQFFKPGDLVFDIGACVGSKTAIYLAADAGRVIAVDPQPAAVDKLTELFKDNERVVVVPYGIAAKQGELTLSLCVNGLPLATFSPEWQEYSRYRDQHGFVWGKTRVEVPVITLDDLIDQYGMPAYCKIDVENFEHEVLSGLSRPIPTISFEFHLETIQNTKKCLDLLDRLGYTRFNIVLMDSWQFAFDAWVSAHELIPTLMLTHTRNRFGEILCGDIYAQVGES